MSMVISVIADPQTIIMTADKRITISDINTGKITDYSDDYQKIRVIADRFILSFAGHSYIVETALDYINEHLRELINLDSNKVKEFFQTAFRYGKESFKKKYPNLPPITVFYLGYLNNGIATLLGFSSDDNFEGKEIEAAIKVHANKDEEEMMIQATQQFISNEVQRTGPFYSYRELANVYFKSIKQVNNPYIGKTCTSVVLSPMGIEKYEHS
jgi:hypothetical protein